MSQIRICSIINCDNKHYAKNLCKKHYNNEYQKQWIKNNYKKRQKSVKRWKNKNPKKIKQWYTNNSEKIKEKSKEWTKNNRKKHRGSVKKWKKNNLKKSRELSNNWNKNHPESLLKANLKQFEKLSKIFDMTSKEYQYALISWSKTIKKLDNNICKNCDSPKNLNAHHIMPKSEFPKLSLDLNNGITLCKECHTQIHGFDIY